jgi:arylsulfatase
MILVDTLRADRLGCYGHTRATTPHIDALAAESVRFEYAVSQAPWTTPSVASLLSSRFPSELGVRDVTSPVTARFSWLPEEVQRAGYTTGAVVSHSFVSAKWGFARGFDVFDETNVKGQRAVTAVGVTDAAIAFVDSQPERPFLLLAHYFDPHFALIEHEDFGFQDAAPYAGRIRSPVPFMLFGNRRLKLPDPDVQEMLRIYDSEIAFTDREIGRLLEHLRARGVYEQAIIVLTADHGEEFLEHGRVGHTRTLYDELIRVPLLLKVPGVAARVETAPVALVDVFPTLLSAIGLEARDDLEGVDLLAPAAEPRAIFSETSRQAELRAVVRGRHKLVRDLRAGQDRLYDRSEDPSEQRDLRAAQPEVAAELAGLLEAWQGEHGPGEAPAPLELDEAERERLRALGYGESAEGRSPALVAAPPEVFEDPPPVPGVQAFDVVATDVDLDGDADVLINWHHVGPLDLLENVEGHFRQPEGQPGAGLFQNLHAPREVMLRRIRAEGTAGLHLWHDVSRSGRWRLLWLDPDGSLGGLSLDLETSIAFVGVQGLSEVEYAASDERTASIRLGPAVRERAFAIQTRPIGVRLELRRRSLTPGSPIPPLFVGPALEPVPGTDFQIWKPDPHGMAWLDLEGSAHPELLVVRGALAGKLLPPLVPKRGRYFLYAGEGAHYRAASNALPADYGRDRRIEAVDVDNDGALELWIGVRGGPNRLLAGNAATGFRDRAGELGLDRAGGAVGAWADHDGDGWQDLHLVEGGSLDVLRNVGGRRFERISGASLGLLLPPARPARRLFDPAQLRFADLDRDGDLDLWLLAHGGQLLHRVFRRGPEGFTDATPELGLDELSGGRVVLVLDLDRDGFPDGLRLGKASAIWQNRSGARFDALPLPPGSAPMRLHAAAALDADGDGALDVLAVGQERRLLLNRTQTTNRSLEVQLPPGRGVRIGALVTAVYSDGTRQVQRYGSEHSSAYSQALQPLRFGVPADLEVESVSVRWPGEQEVRRHPVHGRDRLVLER